MSDAMDPALVAWVRDEKAVRAFLDTVDIVIENESAERLDLTDDAVRKFRILVEDREAKLATLRGVENERDYFVAGLTCEETDCASCAHIHTEAARYVREKITAFPDTLHACEAKLTEAQEALTQEKYFRELDVERTVALESQLRAAHAAKTKAEGHTLATAAELDEANAQLRAAALVVEGVRALSNELEKDACFADAEGGVELDRAWILRPVREKLRALLSTAPSATRKGPRDE